MLGTVGDDNKAQGTRVREAFFLEFAKAIRHHFPSVHLAVTGGFRTRSGMEAAVSDGDCDMIGIGRPAVLDPFLPKDTILNSRVKNENAKIFARTVEMPWILKQLGIRPIGAGIESVSQNYTRCSRIIE
jgi:2,4-dienoyl-CoA reductase-like NADH-dependent reductase (Old Yellow Enzyme family)